MSSNKGVTLWLPYGQALSLLEELEARAVSPDVEKARDALRVAIAGHRLGTVRRPKKNERSQ